MLPLADQADITTGGPTLEYADFDPRTTPAGEVGIWHITATGASGSYDVVDGVTLTVAVGDDEATIQAAADAAFAPGVVVVVGDWNDFTYTYVTPGAVAVDQVTVDDSGLTGGAAQVTQTDPGRAAGLIRPLSSMLRVVDLSGTTIMLLENVLEAPFGANWMRVGTADSDGGTTVSTVKVTNFTPYAFDQSANSTEELVVPADIGGGSLVLLSDVISATGELQATVNILLHLVNSLIDINRAAGLVTLG